MKKLHTFAILLLTTIINTPAQDAAVKTNILSDGLLNPNAAVEIALARKWTTELSGEMNLWKPDNDRQWRHWVVQPEIRYWLCDRLSGHFFGAHLLGGQYNIGGIDAGFSFLGTDFGKLRDTRFQGWFAGAGLAYGYDWTISTNWNIEGVIGFGWTYTRYDQFRCTGCGKKIKENTPHNYVGPTKIAININYIF